MPAINAGVVRIKVAHDLARFWTLLTIELGGVRTPLQHSVHADCKLSKGEGVPRGTLLQGVVLPTQTRPCRLGWRGNKSNKVDTASPTRRINHFLPAGRPTVWREVAVEDEHLNLRLSHMLRHSRPKAVAQSIALQYNHLCTCL
jgi:hypothetical protein